MQLDQNPFFRKAITPWYDSNPACWFLVLTMMVVFMFALVGIIVGATTPEFLDHIGFPLFLAFLSLFLAVKVSLRVRRRNLN